MLTLWRRHIKSCAHQAKGRLYTKCTCPIWCDGDVDGKRVRKSMDTRDWARAMRNLGKIEDPKHGLKKCPEPECDVMLESGRCKKHSRTVPQAVIAYILAHQDVAPGTQRSRKRTMEQFEEFIAQRSVPTVEDIDLETLNQYRAARPVGASTWTKELGTIRQFFRFCLDNQWISRNWAQRVATPKNVKPAVREPYEPNEVARIIAACDQMGRGPYERLRSRAMILLLRYTALRISDVATLEKNRVRNGEIFLRTAKNGKSVRLPVRDDLQAALDVLPLPRGASSQECKYYFWSGNGSTDAVIRDAKRSLEAVFKLSGVPGACPHRFRHTLATEVLELGGTFEDAADILGDTEATVRKHYAKWSSGRQARISDLLTRIWHTKKPDLQTIETKPV